MSSCRLKLYITGDTARSHKAVNNLQHLCNDLLEGECDMVVIDVLERPQLAEDDRIFATPTLIKELPPPVRRIIGDLSDLDSVINGLELSQFLKQSIGRKE